MARIRGISVIETRLVQVSASVLPRTETKIVLRSDRSNSRVHLPSRRPRTDRKVHERDAFPMSIADYRFGVRPAYLERSRTRRRCPECAALVGWGRSNVSWSRRSCVHALRYHQSLRISDRIAHPA